MNANYKSIISAISLLLALSASTPAAPGDLDPTFGSGGIVLTSGLTSGGVSFQLYQAWAMAIQPDGKIVVVGEGIRNPPSVLNWDFAVVRYNPDGSLDTSFGGTGIVVTQLSVNFDGATSVAIQADGKIVVAGGRYVVRYNPNGSLDTSFNGTGIVTTPSVGVLSLAIQPDGKIVVAGSSINGSTLSIALVRYNADGSLDTTFNGTGKVITPGGGATSVAIQADGKIIAAGESQDGLPAFTLVRYHADGTPDTSFNGTGKVSTPVGNARSGASDLAIQPDGKIVAAGYSLAAHDNWRSADFAVVRYNPGGSLDTSFGGTGKILIPDSELDYAYSVAIQPNGKIVVAGSRGNIAYKSAVVRLNPNGSPDTSFNGTGKVSTSFGYAYDHLSSVAIQADGKIVVAGDTGPEDFKDFVVARYQGDDPTPAACPNPIDCAEFFVRQHYLDFLSREPEASGLQAWLGVLNGCPNPFNTDPNSPSAACDRIAVSASFFLSPEFRLKGFYAFTSYRVAFGRRPEYAEIIPDMQGLSGATAAEVYQRRAQFSVGFTARAEFRALYDSLSDAAFVAALLDRYGLQAVTAPDPADPEGGAKVLLTRADLIARLGAQALTRAQVLRAVVESEEVGAAEFNRAFVAMQYYGYLRRSPEESGYEAWLRVINQDPGNVRLMINGFINSTEYALRFRRP